MTEPEAEVQATANLSPVSPSPVHTAAPLVVPALQDTVDTIDAMVAAATGAAEGHADHAIVDPALAAVTADNGDVVDDDSFNDADPYGEESEPVPSIPTQNQPGVDPSDSNDDYAKTFDSPIEPDEGDGADNEQHMSSSPGQLESNSVPVPSEPLNIGHSSDVHAATTQDPSAATSHPDDSAAGHQENQTVSAVESASATEQPLDSQDDSVNQTTQPQPSNVPGEGAQEMQDSSVDIQKLMADLTAPPPIASASEPDPSSAPESAEPPTGSSLPSASSLPPRPPLPHSSSQPYASQHLDNGSNPNASAAAAVPQSSAYVAAGAPGTSTEAVTNLPPPPPTGLNVPQAGSPSMNAPFFIQTTPGYPADKGQDVDYQRQWDQFMADERQYMSEAKWDRFPEGSRIFIGNLSSDKVSKRDVFDLFHRHGRLAQISLKSAYGFVQYHTIEEGRAAMENLQGFEIKGRRIHLEVSRVQDKSKKERNRSPDRGRGRDGGRESRDSGRRNDKHGAGGRDDYRPGRNHSPRRSNDYHSRDDSYGGRDRGYNDTGRGGRGRSRSPGYGRGDRDSYRRRSPSPHGRQRNEPELDLPRRYGADVPDVQIILQPDVNRDFVSWVEGAFKSKGLKAEVMFLHPRFPKDQVIQRQAAEGVHAVVDLDLRAQNLGRVPVQVFDRSNGNSNVRFDQYVDLDPGTAAEVILRAKVSAAAANANYNPGYGSGGGYQNSYGAQQPVYGGASQRTGTYHPQAPPQQPPAASPADIASLVGQVDNATLQRLLASIQGPAGAPAAGGYGHPGIGNGAGAPNSQVDIQAILGSLGGGHQQGQHHAPPPPHHGQYGAPYGGQPPTNGSASHGSNGDAAAQVQNIMAQLSRYR